MDGVASLSASALAASTVAGSVSTSVLSSVQTLDKIVAAKLFGSLGIGNHVDQFA